MKRIPKSSEGGKLMRGDCFDRVYYKVEYDCLDKLKEYMEDGLINYNFANIEDYKFMLHNLFEGFYKIAEAKIWMERLDYYLGCDDGELCFQERLTDELKKLADNKERDKRCFDCFRMGNNGCTILNNHFETITLTDSAYTCRWFIPVEWARYKIKENAS
jgi:hypothetical protein